MARINKERERELTEAAERAFADAGYTFTKIKFKHYVIEKGGRRQKVILRTSTNRWIGFAYARDGWVTLSDPDIDGVVIAAFDQEKEPWSEMIVYPVIARAQLQPRFEEARATYAAGGIKLNDPRVWVCLDHRSTGRVWDAGSGIVEGLAPIACYPLRPARRHRVLLCDDDAPQPNDAKPSTVADAPTSAEPSAATTSPEPSTSALLNEMVDRRRHELEVLIRAMVELRGLRVGKVTVEIELAP
jgi:hypothetical protein